LRTETTESRKLEAQTGWVGSVKIVHELSAGDKRFFSDIIAIIRSGRNTDYCAVNSAIIETYRQIMGVDNEKARLFY
jgi:hypothetical protein